MSRVTGLSSITGLSSFINLSVDVTPDAVNWTDVTQPNAFACDPWKGTNVVQITGIDSSITLSLSYSSVFIYRRVSSSSFSANGGGCSPSGIPDDPEYSLYTYTPTGSSFKVNNDQYVAFVATGRPNSPSFTPATITVTNTTAGAVLDTFQVIDGGGCYLTTVMVSHFGLADDGPELTAMRSLRSHYESVDGYAAVIADYYKHSSQIIAAIESAGSQTAEYSYIHATVLAIVNHVDLGEWQQAHDLYMAMYMDLKTRYIN